MSRTRILSYALKIRVLYASKKRVATPIVILVSLIIRRRVLLLRFCARVKAHFSVRVFGLKKLFWKTYNPYAKLFCCQFFGFLRPFTTSPSRITNKTKNLTAFRDIIINNPHRCGLLPDLLGDTSQI